MTIEETTEAIIRWVKTSANQEHLGLCMQAHDEFLYKRYQYIAEEPVLSACMNKVANAILERQGKLQGIDKYIDENFSTV